jgi:hypothetical protein
MSLSISANYRVVSKTRAYSRTKLIFSRNYFSFQHMPADVYVVKSNAMGDTPTHCRSHLGHLLSPGDTVLG